jgi:hypothetical protein
MLFLHPIPARKNNSLRGIPAFYRATTRMGKIEDGTTTSDFDEEEIRRTISLSTSVIRWNTVM